jgi:hypothetical protein
VLFYSITLLNVPAVLRVGRRKCNLALLYDHSTFHTLSVPWPYLDTLVLFGVYVGSKFCHSRLEIVDVRGRIEILHILFPLILTLSIATFFRQMRFDG